MSFFDLSQISSAVDVVAIYDADFVQIIPDSRPMRCSVIEPTKNMEHPIETGSVVTDHRVVLPIEISMTLRMEPFSFSNDYKVLKQALNAATLFTISTRTGIYTNMLLVDMPHDETPEIYDTIEINLKFKEVLMVTATFESLPPRKVENKDNSSTKQRGQQSTKAPTATQQTQVTQAKRSWLKDLTTPEGH